MGVTFNGVCTLRQVGETAVEMASTRERTHELHEQASSSSRSDVKELQGALSALKQQVSMRLLRFGFLATS